MGAAAAANLAVQIHHVDGHDITRVHVTPSGVPVEATVTYVKNGQHEKQTRFFIRILNGTEAIDGDEKQKYIDQRWPT